MKKLILLLTLAACGDNIHPVEDAGLPPKPTTPDWCVTDPVVLDPKPTNPPDAGVEPGKCEIKLDNCLAWCEWKYEHCTGHEPGHEGE